MDNQAQMREGFTAMSTSIRIFPGRLGRIPTKEEYMADVEAIAASGAEICRYINFNQSEECQGVAKTVAA